VNRRLIVLSLSILSSWMVLELPAFAGAGCHEVPRPFDAAVQVVDMKQNCFSPTVVRVEPKQSVTWVNRDLEAHTVTGVGETWGSYDGLAHGDRVTHSWAATGVYPYSCVFHPGMVGVVVVGDGVALSARAPREGDAVSAGDVSLAQEQPTAGASSRNAGDASASAPAQRSWVSWLWAAPLLAVTGVLGTRRVARRRPTS
jgi:plastocyanin